MDCLRVVGLLGRIIGCIHACRKHVCLLREIKISCRLATFEHSQIARVPTDGAEVQPDIQIACLWKR
jgi:hypothetical protein